MALPVLAAAGRRELWCDWQAALNRAGLGPVGLSRVPVAAGCPACGAALVTSLWVGAAVQARAARCLACGFWAPVLAAGPLPVQVARLPGF